MTAMKYPEKEALIMRWEQSGKNILSFCREENISHHSFRYWQKKLHPPADRVSGFIRLKKKPIRSSGARCMEVVPGKRCRIIFYDYPPAAYIRELLS
jgi:hypothetical protein